MRFVHRTHADAPVAEVWRLLAEPRRWAEFEMFLQRVTGAPGTVRTGQRLLGVVRGIPLRIPIDVREVRPGRLLSIAVRTAPGMTDHITVELVPSARGGTDIRLTTEVEGVFATFAYLPSWAAAGLRLRRFTRRVRASQPGGTGRRSRIA